ncbi:MAG: type II toxin-antitoxin system VapC family toxin [Sedimenticola sp.]
MIAADTNILVRLLSRDDEEQFLRAYQLFNENRVFISTTVVLECERVLRYAYKLPAHEFTNAMHRLFGLENIELEAAERVAAALSWHEDGIDFADALHLTATPENSTFYTFNEKLIKCAANLLGRSVQSPKPILFKTHLDRC